VVSELGECRCIGIEVGVRAEPRVDLADSGLNICYPVAADPAFADRPLGLPATPMVNA
jgi:hypothetical protein